MLSRFARAAAKKVPTSGVPRNPERNVEQGHTPRTPSAVLPASQLSNLATVSQVLIKDAAHRRVRDRKAGASQEKYDVVILTARSVEYDCVLKVFPGAWVESVQLGVLFQTGIVRLGGEDISVAVACQNEMGMVSSAVLATKAHLLRPKCIAMTGFCAGVPDKETIRQGHIIVAQEVFDHGAGKIVKGKLLPDYRPVPINSQVCSLINDFSRDQEVLDRIWEDWNGEAAGRPSWKIRAHLGAVASGSPVVNDEDVVREIQSHKRTLIGIDMEAFGVAKAAVEAHTQRPIFLIIKGVADFAGVLVEKSDEFQEFCAYASASFLREFLTEHWRSVRSAVS